MRWARSRCAARTCSPSTSTGPDATAEAFADGWFRTGDVGTRDPDGYYRIVGRKATDIIKSGGYKIGAGEIENALLEHPAVAEVAVTGEPDDDLGERIVAWVVPAGAGADADELVDHVARLLTPHKRPRVVRFVESLPRNDMGKVMKRALRCVSRRASLIERLASAFTELPDERTAPKVDGPLGWPGYDDALARARERTGERESVVCGVAEIGGVTAVVVAFEFGFLGGSLGTRTGARIEQAFTQRARTAPAGRVADRDRWQPDAGGHRRR